MSAISCIFILNECLINPYLLFNTGKLLSRSQKIAYTLLNRNFSKGETVLKTGDRVALIYPNNDPINFMCALYGCLQAGMVPVPIEVPITRRVSKNSKFYNFFLVFSDFRLFHQFQIFISV